jgi:hypothetical protein
MERSRSKKVGSREVLSCGATGSRIDKTAQYSNRKDDSWHACYWYAALLVKAMLV